MKILRNCVMVARQTLTLFVWVQILVPQPKKQLQRVKPHKMADYSLYIFAMKQIKRF